MDNPLPPLMDDAIDTVTLDSNRKKLVSKVTLKSVIKFVCLALPAIPAWIGLSGIPVLAQARPIEAQPFNTTDSQGNAEIEMDEYTESDVSAGGSPNFVQPVAGSLVTVGEFVALKIITPESRRDFDGTDTSTDRS